ncbi:MAG: hypothetical protein AABW67_05095 [Nanoarchaeota archaeon]
MVHKKYIIKNGKKFGPYLYENYREKGITKTRYLGRGNDKKEIKKNVLIIIGIFVLLAAVFSGLTFLVYQTNLNFFKGELPNSGLVNVAVQIMASSPPKIIIDKEIFVCENKYLDYPFQVTDLTGVEWLAVGISKQNPFNVKCVGDNSNHNLSICQIYSGTLYKLDILNPNSKNPDAVKYGGYVQYPQTISAIGRGGNDFEKINITLIEINNAPEIDPFGITTLEIWDKGINSKYVHKLNVDDVEVISGKFPASSLKFDYKFLSGIDFIQNNPKIFNTATGLINITGNASNLGNYKIQFCVNDSGLLNHHPNFGEYCSSGSNDITWESIRKCTNLSLTITNTNRAPVIVSHYPNETNLNPLGNQELYFNVSAYDPDGTFPLNYSWYLNNILESEGFDNFKYTFGCGVTGNFNVSIIVSDGLNYSSVNWNVSVGYVACPAGVSSGGGGGGGKVACSEKWICGEWNQCKNLENEKSSNNLNFKDYDLIKNRCNLFNYNSETCGIQFRDCIDTKNCKTSLLMPGLFSECYYTQNPNCKDGIKNCHDGSCEILIDCGGPCDACPTCEDGIKNQNEAGIDCGGVCSQICEEIPLRTLIINSMISYLVIGISILLALLVFFQIKKYKNIKQFYNKNKNKEIINNSIATIFLIGFVFILVFAGNFFILNVTDLNRNIVTEPGFLASYGLINNLFGNLFMGSGIISISSGPPPDFTWFGQVNGKEDEILIYDFRNNVTGDEMFFSIYSINDFKKSFFEAKFPWITIESIGNLTINSTKDSETGVFNISIAVVDNSGAGSIKPFYFNISPVNDAPQFSNLEDKVLSVDESFDYIINVSDEENNLPLDFKTEIIKNTLNSNTLSSFSYSKTSEGFLNISFTPLDADVGSYLINFSVNDSFGASSSKLVTFNVSIPVWNKGIILDYSANENDNFRLNLTDLIRLNYQSNVLFENGSIGNFTNFNISKGMIDLTLEDSDVGLHYIEITAKSLGLSSTKLFFFNITNINDNPIFEELFVNYEKIYPPKKEITIYENLNSRWLLYALDDDFKIKQKDYYDEVLNVNVTLEGPNPNLFNFIFQDIALGNQAAFTANFTPRTKDVGEYNLTINISDKIGNSEVQYFNLTVLTNPYDIPVINSPLDIEFSLIEGQNYNLSFNVTHKIGDELFYKFYVNEKLEDIDVGFGNGKIYDWSFTPDYTSETYGEKINLTLFVENPLFNTTRTWNLTINHSNAPIEFFDNIDPITLSYKDTLPINLKEHFYDIDFYDSHYNQSVTFNLSSNSNPSYINQINVFNNWTFSLSSLKSEEYSEIINIIAYDLDENGDKLTSITSDNFTVNFTKPIVETVPVPTPVSSGGGGGSSQIVSLKIITPGRISAFAKDKIEIPLQLINTGSSDFNELTLGSFAFKDGKTNQEIKTLLDKTSLKSLAKGKQENLSLSVFFDTDKLGDYEILVNVSSKTPKYTDWAKIYINLQAINESSVKDLIIFTEEIIAGNPSCIELREILNEAEKSYAKGDYADAKIKSQEAVSACKKSIESLSIPRRNFKDYSLMFYFALGILFSLILGLIYYLYRKEKFAKPKQPEQQSFNKPKDIINQKEGI